MTIALLDLWDNLYEFFFSTTRCLECYNFKTSSITKKGASSITEYCHNLKNLVDTLSDVDSEITKVELVMQILCQLPPVYHWTVDVITHMKSFPSFLQAKNMLLLHESREENVDLMLNAQKITIVALYAVSNQPEKSKNK